MTFSYTVYSKYISGSKRVIYGTFTNDSGSTGGDITTGLHVVENFQLQHTDSAVVATEPKANETFPLVNTAVTIVTVADTTGLWRAEGT